MELGPGDSVGSLEIERELGRGAFGTVYLARDRLIDRPVALKAIRGTGESISGEKREQILREVRILGSLACPNIVTLYGLHEAEDGGFLQELEFVPGGSLEDRIAGGPLPVSEVVRVVEGVLTALEAAHAERIVHGDIKPENVLFGADDVVKLADFGVALIVDAMGGSAALEGRVIGSPMYMAPEVISGESVSPASDLWSVGVMLYRLITGRLPFHAANLMAMQVRVLTEEPAPLGEDIPEALGEIVRACLTKEPKDRPPSAGVLRRMLGRLSSQPTATNLQPEAHPLVGRKEELALARALLADPAVRLVTITGPVGAGKSRLLRETGRRSLEGHLGGVFLVDAAGAAAGTELGERCRQALARAAPGQPTLLLLDHPEGLLPEAADDVHAILAERPTVSVVAASHRLLGLRGERPVRLGPLRGEEAATLLEQFRGGALGDSAELTAIALGGWPGALQAAALGADPLRAGQDYLAEAVKRQVASLSEGEREVLTRLAQLPEPITLFSAEDDLSDLPGDAPFVIDVIQDLCDRSLLLVDDREGECTYRFYPHIRRQALA